MLLRTPGCIGESHLRANALSAEVLRDAILTRHIRRREIAVHAYADRVNRPFPGVMLRQIGNHVVDESLCY